MVIINLLFACLAWAMEQRKQAPKIDKRTYYTDTLYLILLDN